MGQRRQAGPRAGPDVHRGTGNGAGGGHTAKQRGHQVGDSLPEQFAVGIVLLADRHGVGHRRGQQRLQRAERGDGQRRGQHSADQPHIEEIPAGPWNSGGQRAQLFDVQMQHADHHGGQRHNSQRHRQGRTPADPDEDHSRHRQRHDAVATDSDGPGSAGTSRRRTSRPGLRGPACRASPESAVARSPSRCRP